jgi:hypothetical protein
MNVSNHVVGAVTWEQGPASSLALPTDLCWLRDVWAEFQGSRNRDAVYVYLGGVFDLLIWWVKDCKLYPRVRHSLQVCGGDCSKMPDPIAAVIFCSADPKSVDRKTRSKWCRVLWYASHQKTGNQSLKHFIKASGGINACAGKYAARLGRHSKNRKMNCKKRCRQLRRTLRGVPIPNPLFCQTSRAI